MFGYKFYPNPDNFTLSRMVWKVTFSKSGHLDHFVHFRQSNNDTRFNYAAIEISQYRPTARWSFNMTGL